MTTHQQETACHDKWCDKPTGHKEKRAEDRAHGEAQAERGVHEGVNFTRTVWESEKNKDIEFEFLNGLNELYCLLFTGWRRISEIMYGSTVTSI